MSFSEIIAITPYPFLNIVIALLAIVAVLYFARTPAHYAIRSLSRVIHNSMRLSAHSVMRAEQRLMERNREVLLAQGQEAAERMIEREFERIDASVRRDLAEYPALHRQLSEKVTEIDEDYKESTEVPPEPPGWVKAVEAVAKIPAKSDPMVVNVLEDIHDSLIKANTNAIEEYRKASHKRHMFLKEMMPHWRKVLQVLAQVDKNVNSLLTRSKSIDRHMADFEGIVKKTDRAVRMLSSSSMTQFFVSGFVLLIAVGGAMINFNLIALPMSEMVGAKSEIIGFPTSDVAALVIILVEIAMGLFLMESLRITRLFPVIGALNDKLRVRMIWITFSILLILASVEAGLAYMREILAEQRYAAIAALTAEEGAAAVELAHSWITTAAQMGMGFVLPFALTFVAIPLESFVHSLRTVLGILLVGFLRALVWLLRVTGNISRFIGNGLINVYDLLIFAPLWIERMIRGAADDAEADKNRETPNTASIF